MEIKKIRIISQKIRIRKNRKNKIIEKELDGSD
jgi:hypothetical protein